MNKQEKARQMARERNLDVRVTTFRATKMAHIDVTCPQAKDAQYVLSWLGRNGWRTTIQGRVIHGEISVA